MDITSLQDLSPSDDISSKTGSGNQEELDDVSYSEGEGQGDWNDEGQGRDEPMDLTNTGNRELQNESLKNQWGNHKKLVGIRFLFPPPCDSMDLLERARIWAARHDQKYFVGWTEDELKDVDPKLRPLSVITKEMYKTHMNRSEYCRNVKLKFCLEADTGWAEAFREKLKKSPAEGGFTGLCQVKIAAAELWRRYSENYRSHQARRPAQKVHLDLGSLPEISSPDTPESSGDLNPITSALFPIAARAAADLSRCNSCDSPGRPDSLYFASRRTSLQGSEAGDIREIPASDNSGLSSSSGSDGEGNIESVLDSTSQPMPDFIEDMKRKVIQNTGRVIHTAGYQNPLSAHSNVRNVGCFSGMDHLPGLNLSSKAGIDPRTSIASAPLSNVKLEFPVYGIHSSSGFGHSYGSSAATSSGNISSSSLNPWGFNPAAANVMYGMPQLAAAAAAYYSNPMSYFMNPTAAASLRQMYESYAAAASAQQQQQLNESSNDSPVTSPVTITTTTVTPLALKKSSKGGRGKAVGSGNSVENSSEYRRSERGLSFLFPSFSDHNMSLLEKVHITISRHKNNYFLGWDEHALSQLDPIVRPKMPVTPDIYKEYCHRNAMKYDSNLQFAIETQAPWADEFRSKLTRQPADGGFSSLCEVKLEAGRLWREYSGKYRMHNIVKWQMDMNNSDGSRNDQMSDKSSRSNNVSSRKQANHMTPSGQVVSSALSSNESSVKLPKSSDKDKISYLHPMNLSDSNISNLLPSTSGDHIITSSGLNSIIKTVNPYSKLEAAAAMNLANNFGNSLSTGTPLLSLIPGGTEKSGMFSIRTTMQQDLPKPASVSASNIRYEVGLVSCSNKIELTEGNLALSKNISPLVTNMPNKTKNAVSVITASSKISDCLPLGTSICVDKDRMSVSTPLIKDFTCVSTSSKLIVGSNSALNTMPNNGGENKTIPQVVDTVSKAERKAAVRNALKRCIRNGSTSDCKFDDDRNHLCESLENNSNEAVSSKCVEVTKDEPENKRRKSDPDQKSCNSIMNDSKRNDLSFNLDLKPDSSGLSLKNLSPKSFKRNEDELCHDSTVKNKSTIANQSNEEDVDENKNKASFDRQLAKLNIEVLAMSEVRRNVILKKLLNHSSTSNVKPITRDDLQKAASLFPQLPLDMEPRDQLLIWLERYRRNILCYSSNQTDEKDELNYPLNSSSPDKIKNCFSDDFLEVLVKADILTNIMNDGKINLPQIKEKCKNGNHKINAEYGYDEVIKNTSTSQALVEDADSPNIQACLLKTSTANLELLNKFENMMKFNLIEEEIKTLEELLNEINRIWNELIKDESFNEKSLSQYFKSLNNDDIKLVNSDNNLKSSSNCELGLNIVTNISNTEANKEENRKTMNTENRNFLIKMLWDAREDLHDVFCDRKTFGEKLENLLPILKSNVDEHYIISSEKNAEIVDLVLAFLHKRIEEFTV